MPDRPAVRVWGVDPGQHLLHPAYRPVYEAGLHQSDLVVLAGSPFALLWGRHAGDGRIRTRELPDASPEWVALETTVDTPQGPLRSVFTASRLGKPGYQKEYLLKEPADLQRVLAIPYEPFPFSRESYDAAEARAGERGIAMFMVDHAMYGLQRIIGSEAFALWSLECREALVAVMQRFAERVRQQVDTVFDAGLAPIFGWYGPELCIPPLMSPADFDDFVYALDRPLIDRIHERGGAVWVHCHGRMGPVLERFVEMGTDVLNPLEPPPMGDVTLAEAFARAGDRMGLEGNIETHDLMTGTAEQVRERVREAVAAGRGRRFILCASSHYMEWPDPDPRLIENLLVYLEEGVRLAKAAKA